MKFIGSRAAAGTALAACAALGTVPAAAQTFPAKPLRMIIPYVAGGNVDLSARTIAQRLGEALGQQVVVENRPGGNTTLGIDLVAKAPPDGYMMGAMANTFVTTSVLLKNLPYEALRDLTGLSMTVFLPQLLVMHPSIPARNAKELVAFAKTRPGQLTYASAGIGATAHIAAALFERQAGIRMTHIPYKGNAQGLVDVVGGQVTMMFDTINTSAGYVRTGKLRGIGVSSLKRSAFLPDVPTIDESGFPGYEASVYNGLVMHAKTPRDILVRLNAEIYRIAQNADLKRRFAEQGVDLVASKSPEEFTEFLRADQAKAAKLVREANISAE